MKEVLCEVFYQQVYGKPGNDGDNGPMLIFYTDGTYFITHNSRWDENLLSHWKIIDNVMWIKHMYVGWGIDRWIECSDNNIGGNRITQLVLAALAEIAVDRMLAGDLGV